MIRLDVPKGKSLYSGARNEIKNKLELTFAKFRVSESKEILGETLLRLDVVNRSAFRNNISLHPKDSKAKALFEMFDYFKSL